MCVTVWSTKEETEQRGAHRLGFSGKGQPESHTVQQVVHGYLARDQQALHLDTPRLPSAKMSHEPPILPSHSFCPPWLSFFQIEMNTASSDDQSWYFLEKLLLFLIQE